LKLRHHQYLGLLAFGLAAFSAQASVPVVAIAPAQAIELAVKAGPAGARGQFEMRVAATGKSHGHVFLNSEPDYRDPRNLSIDIAPWIMRKIEKHFGAPPESFFQGKRIVVSGTVRRVPISILDNSGRAKQLYFQTHVNVLQASQIKVAESPAL
jgi:hypothetical protein